MVSGWPNGTAVEPDGVKVVANIYGPDTVGTATPDHDTAPACRAAHCTAMDSRAEPSGCSVIPDTWNWAQADFVLIYPADPGVAVCGAGNETGTSMPMVPATAAPAGAV